MNYSAKYKKGFFWKKVENITGDDVLWVEKVSGKIEMKKVGDKFVENRIPEKYGKEYFPVRVLYLSDNTRIELPMSCVITFSPSRFEGVRNNAEKTTGQKLPLNNQ